MKTADETINGIIFDLGKVVIDYSFDIAFNIWSESTHIPLSKIKEKFRFDIFFIQYETGNISTEEFYRSVNNKFDNKLNYEDFKNGWSSIYLYEIPGMQELLVELKQKTRIVALTNTSDLHKQVWSTRFSQVLANFEIIFSSHEIGFRKPDLRSYTCVSDYLKMDPNKILFIDDIRENILAGKKIGLNTIHFKNVSQLVSEINLWKISK